MTFNALFIAHAPDADPQRDRSALKTGLYELHTVIVRDQQQGLEICRSLVPTEGIQSVVLCPGHSNQDVAEIAAAVGPGVGVSVARGDGPSQAVARRAMEESGWFSYRT